MKKIKTTRILAYAASSLLMSILLMSQVRAFTDRPYTLLDSSVLGDDAPKEIGSWAEYFKLALKAFYTFIVSAAIFIITLNGIKYMLSEVSNVKKDASNRIWDALIGLVLALAAYLIIYLINPTLLNDNFTNSLKLAP